MKNLRFILVVIVAIFSSAIAVAQEKPTTLTLPSVVGSNMVLQHSTSVNIWGWAQPKATIKINPSWLKLKKPLKVKADAEGMWILSVQTPGASYDAHTITITDGKEVKELTNILFGEVWLCSGQSNMEWPVKKTPDMKEELNNAANNRIRLYCTGRTRASTPQTEVPAQKDHKTQWDVCDPNSLANFSAVGYGFGKELQEALDVPVGLIDASYGGTYIEGWLGVDYLAANTELADTCKMDSALCSSTKWKNKVSFLHNANIHPIRFATVAGIIWYQGCSNVPDAPRYASKLSHLIKSWRTEFRNEDLPFYIVEIVPHTYDGIDGAILREGQASVAACFKNCEIVCTNDQNQIPGNVHPPKKAEVAHRLAQCALGGFYKKTDAEFRSPAYHSMVVEGDAIRVSFKNVPTTLVKKGEGRINGFQLGVADPNDEKLIFHIAEAKIEGNTVLVTAKGITNPVAVRYCFNEDMGNVYSAEGLPLIAFRSDKSNSLSARPLVEKPSDIAINFDGAGFEKTTFTKDANLWPGSGLYLSEVYPAEFEGFEVMVPIPVEKDAVSRAATITAQADGKVYILSEINRYTRNAPWRVIASTYTRVAKDGKLGDTFYIMEREVKAGEVFNIPTFKNPWGVLVLAKSIE